MRRILLSIGMIVFVGALVAGGTGAFFSDTETSSGNTFTAGSIDLRVDSESHYAGLVCQDVSEEGEEPEYLWQGDGNSDTELTRPDLLDQPCSGSWEMTDLGPANTFFNYGDLKPGDNGENTISLHVSSNDAYSCAVVNNMQTNDNGLTEPESEVDQTDGPGNGELQNELRFFAWSDDGDNVWEDGEQALFSNTEGPASDVIDGQVYPLYTPEAQDGNGPMTASSTEYIGMYWCYGDITAEEDGNTLSCDGSEVTNKTQTDSVSADISFYVEQARNNDDFQCPTPEDIGQDRPEVGADTTAYVPPQDCDVTVGGDGANYDTIQNAIDEEGENTTICVADGQYNEFSIDEPGVTIAGLTNPNDGTATVVPTDASVNDLALVTASGVTITGMKFDGSGTTFTGEPQLAGVRISPADDTTDIDNVNITHNVITGLVTANDGAASKGIQWFAASGQSAALTNSTFAHNMISSIGSETNGAYGIQTVGAMDNVTIEHNTISGTVDGEWETGIAIDGKSSVTVDADILRNDIQSPNTDHGEEGGNPDWALSVQVERNVTPDSIVVNENNMIDLGHGGGGLAGNGFTFGSGTIDAEDNWWGTATPANPENVIGDSGSSVIDYDPAENSAFPLNP